MITQGVDNEVQVTTCGCLGMCDDGPIMITYPGGVWYHKIQEEDVPEIVRSHLRSGKVVSRLAWSDLQAMKAEVTEHRDRYRAMLKIRSTILTSQLPVSRWHEHIGDPTLADGILARVVHNAHRIEMRGDSMRKNRSKANT